MCVCVCVCVRVGGAGPGTSALSLSLSLSPSRDDGCRARRYGLPSRGRPARGGGSPETPCVGRTRRPARLSTLARDQLALLLEEALAEDHVDHVLEGRRVVRLETLLEVGRLHSSIDSRFVLSSSLESRFQSPIWTQGTPWNTLHRHLSSPDTSLHPLPNTKRGISQSQEIASSSKSLLLSAGSRMCATLARRAAYRQRQVRDLHFVISS